MIASTLRYYHTVVHLKPVQIYWRLALRLYRPRPKLSNFPRRRSRRGRWVEPIQKPQSMLGPNRFRFLNHEGHLSSAADWNNPAQEKLWTYNLHYFDDLSASDADGRRDWHGALLDRWIAQNPVAQGNGWEPYPVSLRLVNWIKWALNGGDLQGDRLESAVIQTRWLSRRLEWHLLGNHLLANAKALVFAGLFFEGPEADRWLRRGLEILTSQLAEQVLADGGHFELSPMYHAIVLEDLLDLINISGTFPGHVPSTTVAGWRETTRAMHRWLAIMSHPDGRISYFNDAAFGIAADLRALRTYSERLGLRSVSEDASALTHLDQSGYVRLETGAAVALLDVGPIGPDFLPGHAHADTLSFEFTLGLDRVIVNCGTSCYGAGPERQRQRSTAAHSTVEIDRESSSEVWAGFRVARRARTFDYKAESIGGETSVSCAHDGYRRLAGRPVHRRRWTLGSGHLKVEDTIDGAFDHAHARFHLAPGIGVSLDADSGEPGSSGRLQVGSRVLKWRTSERAELRPSEWHPEFGLHVPTQCITVPFTGRQVETVLEW